MENFDYITYLKNNKLLTEIKVNNPVEVFKQIQKEKELDEASKPDSGGSNPLGPIEREPNGKKSSNLKNKATKISKLAHDNSFAMEMDIQDLLPEERINYIINNFKDWEIESFYTEWFGDDMNENLKENIKNIVRRTLAEMSMTGPAGTVGAGFTPGMGEQYATKYAFKKKKKNGKYTSK